MSESSEIEEHSSTTTSNTVDINTQTDNHEHATEKKYLSCENNVSNTIKELIAKVEKSTSEYDAVEENLKKVCQDLRLERQKLSDENDVLKSKIDDMQVAQDKEINRMEQISTELTATNNSVSQEKDTKITEKNREIRDKDREIHALKSDLKLEAKRMQNLEESRKELNDRCGNLEVDLHKSKDQIKTQDKKIGDLQNKGKKTDASLKKMTEERDRLNLSNLKIRKSEKQLREQ
ncbi:uncharacterized protein [Antedon mediterranea]|uniref:uncharacterized protein n=1 Tax=Antedon mediterranea TaxID=105859 RepID=UPI003AF8D1AF